MLTIRTRTFDINQTAEIAFSRIDWKIEKVKRFTNPLLNHSTADTTKPWVGKIDREKREFKIIQTAPFFTSRLLEGNFFQLYILGQILDEGQKSKVCLRFEPGLYTTLLFTALYLFPIIVSVSSLGDDGWKGLILGLPIPIIFTLLFIVQLNRTENKLFDLFGG